MALGFTSFGGGIVGKATAAAGTAFYAILPPLATASGYTRLASFSYTGTNTAHTLTIMRPIGRAVLASAAASGQADVVLNTSTPYPTGNTIASGDQVVLEQDDGTYTRHSVSAWNGTTKTLTLSANLSANVAANNKLWNFGVFGDTDPVTGLAFPGIPTISNDTLYREFAAAGAAGAQKGDPLLLHSGNATGAGTLDYAEFAYTVE